MVVNDKTLKSFGFTWLIMHRASSPLRHVNHHRVVGYMVSYP